MARPFLIALLVAAVAAPAYAQSLGEAAAREKERRARQREKSGPAKTYTDEDLEKGADAKDKKKASESGGESSSSSAKETSSGGSDEGPDRSVWEDRAEKAREAIKNAQERIATLQNRIAELQTDMNPNPSDLMDPNRLQKREAEKAAAIQELDQAKAALAKAQADQQKLEDDARREHIPPGWIR
jgi:hypothetical protein